MIQRPGLEHSLTRIWTEIHAPSSRFSGYSEGRESPEKQSRLWLDCNNRDRIPEYCRAGAVRSGQYEKVVVCQRLARRIDAEHRMSCAAPSTTNSVGSNRS